VLYPRFDEVRGGVEPWLMARWKARVEFLLNVIELLFPSLMVEALQGKCVKTRCLQEKLGHLEPRFQGKGSSPWQYVDTSRKAIDCATTLPLTVFGRPFVKRFALCYQTVVCLSVCPVCPVCDVRALWPNGWTDQDETRHACMPQPWPYCVRWRPTSPTPKGHSPPPIFRPVSVILYYTIQRVTVR